MRSADSAAVSRRAPSIPWLFCALSLGGALGAAGASRSGGHLRSLYRGDEPRDLFIPGVPDPTLFGLPKYEHRVIQLALDNKYSDVLESRPARVTYSVEHAEIMRVACGRVQEPLQFRLHAELNLVFSPAGTDRVHLLHSTEVHAVAQGLYSGYAYDWRAQTTREDTMPLRGANSTSVLVGRFRPQKGGSSFTVPTTGLGPSFAILAHGCITTSEAQVLRADLTLAPHPCPAPASPQRGNP